MRGYQITQQTALNLAQMAQDLSQINATLTNLGEFPVVPIVLTAGSSSMVVGPDIPMVWLTMIGGGGAGGIGQNGSMFSGGGGGGAGAALVSVPIAVNSRQSLQLFVGQGGTASNPDGQDSIVRLYDVNNNLISQFTAQGGKGALFDVAGASGVASAKHVLSGDNGAAGSIVMPSMGSAPGGNGGSSFFAAGGLGALTATNGSLTGTNGVNGSGGGGSAIGSSAGGNGGNGFIRITI